MPRENSFSDSEGRSLTPDLDDLDGTDVLGQAQFTPGPSHLQLDDSLPSTIQTLDPTQNGALGMGIVYQEPTAMYSAPASVSFSPEKRTTGLLRSNTVRTRRPGDALARFRASARKVIQLRRSSTAMNKITAGAEPGVDPRHSLAYVSYGHIKENCTIEIADYSSVRSSFGKMGNKGFVQFLADPVASKREPWVKVRWINIGGISWDVISALAIRYDIHPLALEDVLHRREQARSKADYYFQHLFIRILRHTLASQEGGAKHTHITNTPRCTSPLDIDRDSEDEERREKSGSDGESSSSAKKGSSLRRRGGWANKRRRRMSVLLPDGDLEVGPDHDTAHQRPSLFSMKTSPSVLLKRKQYANAITIEEIKKEERVHVSTVPMYLFLYRDGTVISITGSTDISFMDPITQRLKMRDSVLRATADPSLLLQSLLDLVVDQALEVVDEFHKKILKLEHDVLVQPNMKTVRFLHILSGDLTLHKRTLEPIKSLIYGLRRYDVDRCAALFAGGDKSFDSKIVKGYMTHKAKIYLADVHDHIDYILVSLNMFESITENLINYTFNMKSIEMNETMRRLTLATIIFLPLTLLTGYFGMNFTHMNSIERSELFFWKLALPIMGVLLPLFLANDIYKAVHHIKKKFTERRITKEMKSR